MRASRESRVRFLAFCLLASEGSGVVGVVSVSSDWIRFLLVCLFIAPPNRFVLNPPRSAIIGLPRAVWRSMLTE